MVGGLVKDLVMKNTYQVDENLVYSELAAMKVGRFNAPIALLRDKCVLVAGGQVNNSKNKFTNAVELYDSLTNKWVVLDSLQKPRGNTSLTAIASRFVYIYHGLATTT
jgi:N-acetylneuraminic acid mutarotase